jgi:hypothetical protein
MSELFDLEFLYYFSNAETCVWEAKINGLPQAPPEKVFHWLYYDRASHEFRKLGFKSMDSDDDRHHRQFAEGELWFDATEARLVLQSSAGSKEIVLKVNEPSSVPVKLVSSVNAFLRDQWDSHQ